MLCAERHDLLCAAAEIRVRPDLECKLRACKMGDPTENTINDLLANFLRNNGIKITTYPSTRIPSARRTPDFEVLDGGLVYGEGEWESKYIEGFNQAIEFGDIPGSIGYFLIGYPEELKDSIRQQRLVTSKPEVLLSGVAFRGVFKIKGMPSSLFRGNITEIVDWIKSGIQRKRREEPSEFIKLMGNIVQGLTDYLPMKADYPSLFEHIIASIPKGKGELEVARKASAFLLLNQVVFYSILRKRGLQPINYESLQVPAELYTVYFKKVVDEVDYNAIFDFDVASLFPKKSLQFIKDMVRIVSEIQPEEFTRDLLGNIFHSLIPIEVRKPVAAYYTNPMAARLLAKLAIYEPNSTVADFACGSGTLLMAAYERKAELVDRPFALDIHKQFIEKDITGIDIMPFAAHLAVVQLALKNPTYLTDRVRIGVRDSTGLNPGDTIKVLQRVMPRGQQVLSAFAEDNKGKSLVREGALSSKGAGQEFKVSKVDVVIMNPPFTRQEKIPHDLKSSLTERFSEYGKFIHSQMGLRAYFILLADRFLELGGRMALVLPATTLRVESMKGIRDLIAQRYDIDYIITTDYRSAFSESTALREILLVATKRNKEAIKRGTGEECSLVNLKVLPNGQNVSDLEKALSRAKTGKSGSVESDLYSVLQVEQEEFSKSIDDWSVLLHPIEALDELIESFNNLDNICSLKELVKPAAVKRCDYPSIMYVAWERDARTQEKGNILEKTKDGILSRSKMTGTEMFIPNSATQNGLWALSGLPFLDITGREDRIISRSFPDCEHYFDRDVSGIFRNWGIEKLKKYASDFFVPRKLDFCANGTIHLAVRTENPSIPSTSIWGLGNLGDKGKLLALYMHSTLAIAFLLRKRIEVRGSWSQFPKETLLSLPVPNFDSFDNTSTKTLLRLYDSLKTKSFPSLAEQFNSSFDGLVEIDKAVFSALGLEYAEGEIRKIHLAMSKELDQLKEMMARD